MAELLLKLLKQKEAINELSDAESTDEVFVCLSYLMLEKESKFMKSIFKKLEAGSYLNGSFIFKHAFSFTPLIKNLV